MSQDNKRKQAIELMEAFSFVDPDLLERSEQASKNLDQESKKVVSIQSWSKKTKGYGLVAACVGLVALNAIGFSVWNQQKTSLNETAVAEQATDSVATEREMAEAVTEEKADDIGNRGVNEFLANNGKETTETTEESLLEEAPEDVVIEADQDSVVDYYENVVKVYGFLEDEKYESVEATLADSQFAQYIPEKLMEEYDILYAYVMKGEDAKGNMLIVTCAKDSILMTVAFYDVLVDEQGSVIEAKTMTQEELSALNDQQKAALGNRKVISVALDNQVNVLLGGDLSEPEVLELFAK